MLDLHPLRHGVSSLPGGVSALLCRDIDADGDSDLVACEYRSGIVAYENAGDGGSFLIRPIADLEPDAPEMLLCVDLDIDGYPDLVAASSMDENLRWWRNGGDGSWTESLISIEAGRPLSLEAGDVDGDGDSDLLLGLQGPNRLVWLENALPEREWPLHAVSSEIPAARDLSFNPSEGLLAAACWADSSVYLFDLSNGGGSYRRALRAIGPASVLLADMEGDGGVELVVSSPGDDRVLLLPMDRAGAEPSIITGEMIAPRYLDAADLDGDGDSDLLVASMASGELIWCENAGDGVYNARYGASIHGCGSADAGDMNGDGTTDASAASFLDGSVSWLELNQFRSRGKLTSSLLFIGPQTGSISLQWFGLRPAATGVRLEYRLSPDRVRMGEWTEAGSGSIEDVGPDVRFFQYRLELTTEDRGATPLVDSVAVELAGDRQQ